MIGPCWNNWLTPRWNSGQVTLNGIQLQLSLGIIIHSFCNQPCPIKTKESIRTVWCVLTSGISAFASSVTLLSKWTSSIRVERGTRAINTVMNALLFHFIPTIIEIGLVCGIFAYNFGRMNGYTKVLYHWEIAGKPNIATSVMRNSKSDRAKAIRMLLISWFFCRIRSGKLRAPEKDLTTT